jgi:hypothetical protein
MGRRFRTAVLAHRRELLAELARGLDPSVPAHEVFGELAIRFSRFGR